jgi:hypothetical protein
MLSPLKSSLFLVQQVDALAARHRGAIGSCDSFHVSPVGGFLVTRIADYHPIFIDGVHVTLLSPVREP